MKVTFLNVTCILNLNTQFTKFKSVMAAMLKVGTVGRYERKNSDLLLH